MQKSWIRIGTTLMTVCVMVMIFGFSTEPAEQSDSTSGIIARRVADAIRPGWETLQQQEKEAFFDSVQYFVRKTAHFTEFALLGFSLRICQESWAGRKRKLNPLSWAGATGYAVLDEIHQRTVDGRSGQWQDVLIDSAGVLTGVMIASATLYLLYRHRRRTENGETGARRRTESARKTKAAATGRLL